MKKLIAVAMALSTLCFGKVLASEKVVQITPNIHEKVKVKEIAFATPLLKRVCSCESWGDPDKEPRQFLPDGRLLRGYPNPDDVGACQINVPTWGSQAKALGFDIYKLKGNIQMANYILHLRGLSPWSASQETCWGK